MTIPQKPAAFGQVWRDKDTRAQKPCTFEVTSSDGLPGSFAEGVRRPSGRKTRVRLDSRGHVRGYTLMQDAPATTSEDSPVGPKIAAALSEAINAPWPTQPATPSPRAIEEESRLNDALDNRQAEPDGIAAKPPLARVRAALERITEAGHPSGTNGRNAAEALAALALVERVLNAFASISEAQWEALRVACYRNHRALTSGAGAVTGCACGMRNGTSKACEVLRQLQALRVEGGA